jgi:WD40 repeat protein
MLSIVTRRVEPVSDFVFGFDFFISYAHQDGLEYPEGLAERLRDLGYKVCLDRHDYRAGDDLRVLTRRYVRKSNTLVVVVGVHALVSKWVIREVEECLDAGRSVVAIDVNRSLVGADADVLLKRLLADRIYIAEGSATQPSNTVIESLQHRFSGVRQDTFRVRMLGAAALGFAAVGAMATWQWREAVHQRDEAAARLIRQRVGNGTRAATDGDLWSAWAWYANALELANRAGLDERPHRERLQGLRHQIPHLRGVWYQPGESEASAISPDGTLAAIYSRPDRGRDAKHSVIRVFVVSSGAQISEIEVGGAWLREMIFSPAGDELWTLQNGTGPDGQSLLEACIHDARGAGLKAKQEIIEEHSRLEWLNATTLAVIDYTAAHRLRFDNGSITLDTRQSARYSKAISADFNLLASYNSDDRKITVEQTSPPARFTFDCERSPTVVFSPDNAYLIAISYKAITMWRLSNAPDKPVSAEMSGNAIEHQFDIHGRIVLTEERSGDLLATTFWVPGNPSSFRTIEHDQAVARWEFPADSREGAAAGSVVGMSAVNPFERRAMISEDGERLLTVSKRSQSYRVWNVVNGDALTPPLSHAGSKLRSVRLSADSRFIISSGVDGLTRCWDVALPRREKPLVGAGASVSSLEFAAGGARLLSFSGGRIRAFDWNSRNEVGTAGENLNKARLSAATGIVAGLGSDGFRLWNSETLMPVTKWLEHPSISEVAASETGKYAVSWSSRYNDPDHLRIWDARDSRLLREQVLPDHQSVRQLRFDDRRGFLAITVWSDAHKLLLYDLGTGAVTEAGIPPGVQFETLLASPRDGHLLLFDGERFWRIADSRNVAPYSTSRSSLTRFLVASAGGTFAVLTDDDRQIAQVIDVRTGSPRSPEFRHEWKITDARITPDGKRLLTISGNKAHLWDLTSGDAVIPVIRYPDTVTSAALNAQGTAFAVASTQAIDDASYAIFRHILEPDTAAVASLVRYGEVNSQQRIDEAGARLPVTAEYLASAWSWTVQGDAAVKQPEQPPIEWYRQRKSETGRLIYPTQYWLTRILAVQPSDTDARLERAHLYRIQKKHSEALHDLEALSHHALPTFSRRLSAENLRDYSRFLLQYGQPRLAYLLMRDRIDGAWDFVKWMFAMAAYGAGEAKAYRRNASEMLEAARAIADRNAEQALKWNAAWYAALASMLSDETEAEYRAAVALAVRAAGEKLQVEIRILQGELDLKSGALVAAREQFTGLEQYPLAKALIAELEFRRGDPANARRCLAELQSYFDAKGERDGLDIEDLHIQCLMRRAESRLERSSQ